jgi:hypothetical protein
MKTMKRRKMLLCVTATSMVAIVACKEGQPVGLVGNPHDYQTEVVTAPDAEAPNSDIDAAAILAQQPDASMGVVDAGSDASHHKVGRVAVPDFGRVGTTAQAPDNDEVVGKVATPPDKKK